MIRQTLTRLGLAQDFATLPATITIGGRPWYLVRDEAIWRLLSSVCPHQGGPVSNQGTHFECPLHGWRFDRTTGRCLNAPSRELRALAVTEHDGVLYADLPDDSLVERVRHVGRVTRPGLRLQLHAHACLEMSHDGFTLLTDPWLDGPAFLGAWAHYPPPLVSGRDLRPDAMLITHEHSDHFHEPTLGHFDRRTPVYVPDFPNERLPRRLRALGYTDVRPMPFGETCVVRSGWSLTAFEPESPWNDAFVLVDIEGFRIFDINDAGVNHRIARMVAPVDVLAVQFSAGASGFPWTWAHLSDGQKVDVSARACAGKLQLIREAVSVYGASAVVPFASHFTLWHPTHEAYAAQMKRNTLVDVKAALEDSEAELIDLLPGDTWNVGTDSIERAPDDRAGLFEPATLAAYRKTAVSPASFDANYPTDETLTREEIVDYVQQLNTVSEIALCEDLTVRLLGTATLAAHQSHDVSFEIRSAHLDILPTAVDVPNLRITMPLGVLTAIIRQGLSWDEAFIGYWCRFDRHPNVYHAGFWRLLQAPYFRRRLDVRLASGGSISASSTVAEILETYGAEADRILRRYGLYCIGCHHAMAESIETAARQHGIEATRLERLVRELARAFPIGSAGLVESA
jgi:CMP-N-acetylneuraminate monooxygenase